MGLTRITLYAALVGAAFGACIPWPHTEPLAPHLVGILRDSTGAPEVGVPIAIASNQDASGLHSFRFRLGDCILGLTSVWLVSRPAAAKLRRVRPAHDHSSP